MTKYFFTLVCLIGLLILCACSSVNAIEQPAGDAFGVTGEVEAENVFGPGTFSISLPEGWDILGPETITTDPDRPYKLFLLGMDPSGNSGPGISRVIIASASEWTHEELASVQCSTCPQPLFESVMIDGQPAFRAQVGGGEVPILITWYYLENQGNLIAFAIHDPSTLEPLLEVIESIQLE